MRNDAPAPAGNVWESRFRLPIWTLVSCADQAPDRALVASNATGRYQLYGWQTGKPPARVTSDPCGKNSGWISPDGRWIVYLEDEGGREEGRYVRIPFGGGTPENLTGEEPPYWASGFSFARDGRFVAFMTSDPTHGFRFWRKDEGKRKVLLYQHKHEAWGAMLSHDGRHVAFAQSERKPDRNMATAVHAAGDGERIAELWDGPGVRVVPVGFCRVPGDPLLLVNYNSTGRVRPAVWNPLTGSRINLEVDLPGELPGWRWASDGLRVLLAQVHEGRMQLYIYDLEDSTLSRVPHPAGVVDGGWFRPGEKLWINRGDAATPNQVLEIDEATGKSRVLLATEGVPPGTPLESVSFAGARGDRIQAYLGRPKGAAPFPAVLHVHGGPAGQIMDRWMPLLQAWIDAGFMLLSINYHGSTGFGREFEDSIKGDLMNLELEDFAAARQYLIERGADPGRIVFTGASYGGLSTLSALTRQPELWACGVGSIVIGDLALMYEDASAPLQGWCRVYTGGTPDEKPEIYRARSPITHVQNMQAPLLILQGKNDSRTPARQCEQFVEAARAANKDVTLVWFEEGHGTLGIEQAIENARRSVEFAQRAVAKE